MDFKPLSLELTVASVLSAWPQTIPVFLKHHLGCVGCEMAGFDTLADVTRIYNLNPNLFMEELQSTISASLDTTPGSQNQI